MSNELILFLPEDITGTNPDNKIDDEEHILDASFRVIKLHFISYFSESISIKTTDLLDLEYTLEKNVDYFCTDINTEITQKIGKEICNTILFKDNTLNKVKVTYQALGGMTNPNYKGIAITTMTNLQKNPVNWNSILNKPIGFNPKNNHLHDWKDIYGLEYIVQQLNRIEKSIYKQPDILSINLTGQLKQLFDNYTVVDVQANFRHIMSEDNPHRTNKLQVGLGKVINYNVFHEPYVYAIGENDTDSSKYKEFRFGFNINNSSIKYITNYSLLQYSQEIITDIKKTIYTGKDSNVKQSILDLKENVNVITQINNTLNTRITGQLTGQYIKINGIKNLDGIIPSTNNEINLLEYKGFLDNRVYLKINNGRNLQQLISRIDKYYLDEWNLELSRTLNTILEYKYRTSSSYSNIFNVITNLESPDLWLDFSDSSKLTITNNKIVSITDKSTNQRVFSQTDETLRPSLITRTNIGANELNRNTVANITTGKKLIQSSGDPITLNNDFTIIVLTRDKTNPSIILSVDNEDEIDKTNDKLIINVDSFKTLKLDTQKYIANSKLTTNINATNKSNINIIRLKQIDKQYYYYDGNIKNSNYNASFDLFNNRRVKDVSNLISINKQVDYITFNVIGDSKDSTQDFELSEVIIYKRLLSLEEIKLINTYLSRKHSGSTNFTLGI